MSGSQTFDKQTSILWTVWFHWLTRLCMGLCMMTFSNGPTPETLQIWSSSREHFRKMVSFKTQISDSNLHLFFFFCLFFLTSYLPQRKHRSTCRITTSPHLPSPGLWRWWKRRTKTTHQRLGNLFLRSIFWPLTFDLQNNLHHMIHASSGPNPLDLISWSIVWSSAHHFLVLLIHYIIPKL